MIKALSLKQISDRLKGTFQGEDVQFDTVGIDTRTLKPGDLFVAIKGLNFDGHRFVETAAEKGAVAAVVSERIETDLPTLEVADTRDALGLIGAINREQLDGKVLAITGSAGKTTVKEMSAAIMQQLGPVLATRGNFNNEIGVPLTLLELNDGHRNAVLELGASSIGEIAYTAGLVKPDVAVLTNAAEAHIEGFGSLNNVVQAKGEIIDALPPEGTAVLNADDLNVYKWVARAGGRRKVVFSLNPESGADFTARNSQRQADGSYHFELVSPEGTVSIQLKQLGEHNIANALAAAAATMAMGASLADVKAGLENAQSAQGRLVSHQTPQGARMIDDSYNANPEALRAAVDVLSQCGGNKILVLGDMAELGEDAVHCHEEAARYARKQGVDFLLTVGALSARAAREFGAQGRAFKDHETLIEALADLLNNNTTVLVKGSRSAHMERVVQAFTGGE